MATAATEASCFGSQRDRPCDAAANPAIGGRQQNTTSSCRWLWQVAAIWNSNQWVSILLTTAAAGNSSNLSNLVSHNYDCWAHSAQKQAAETYFFKHILKPNTRLMASSWKLQCHIDNLKHKSCQFKGTPHTWPPKLVNFDLINRANGGLPFWPSAIFLGPSWQLDRRYVWWLFVCSWRLWGSFFHTLVNLHIPQNFNRCYIDVT